jgi:Phosphotransferase enzyme family
MNDPVTDAHLSIIDLPAVIIQLFERAQQPLLPAIQGQPGLFVRYLRRKLGRGLAVIYTVDQVNAPHKGRVNDPKRAVSLTLDEQALSGAHIRFNAQQTYQAPLEVLPTGVLHIPQLGIAVQKFPADASLPALVASCDTAPHGPLWQALQRAAQTQLSDEGWQLVWARTEPVRYKPASRCVIQYNLQLVHGQGQGQSLLLEIFGKVYADPAQASRVQLLQQQLYEEQKKAGELPLLPHPLGMLASLGLTFSEAVRPGMEHLVAEKWPVLRTGTRVLQPQVERGRGGTITQILIPEEELRLTGQALARLHCSTVRSEGTPRTGAKEAKQAKIRAALVAARYPALADEVQALAQQLALQLEKLEPESYLPAHGGFKASQLLFHSHHVFVVDFDGFCLADPALDVGYFLAYLRPSGIWYHKQGMRHWFEKAAIAFITAYREAMLTRGITNETVASIIERSRLYEGALIFKIATRRVNRLNSPRPQELSAMLDEIRACLG